MYSASQTVEPAPQRRPRVITGEALKQFTQLCIANKADHVRKQPGEVGDELDSVKCKSHNMDFIASMHTFL